jgi:thymidine phosphorylase
VMASQQLLHADMHLYSFHRYVSTVNPARVMMRSVTVITS